MFEDRFLIESDGRVVGVAVRVRGGFMFFSSDPELRELEAKIFPQATAIGRRVAEFVQAKKGANDQSPADAGNVLPLRAPQIGRRHIDDPPPPAAA
jgi:hypothetical protein